MGFSYVPVEKKFKNWCPGEAFIEALYYACLLAMFDWRFSTKTSPLLTCITTNISLYILTLKVRPKTIKEKKSHSAGCLHIKTKTFFLSECIDCPQILLSKNRSSLITSDGHMIVVARARSIGLTEGPFQWGVIVGSFWWTCDCVDKSIDSSKYLSFAYCVEMKIFIIKQEFFWWKLSVVFCHAECTHLLCEEPASCYSAKMFLLKVFW